MPACTYRRVKGVPQTNGCYRFLPDTWYTVTMHVHVGTWASTMASRVYNSQIDLWVSRTGAAAPVYVLSVKNVGLYNATPLGPNQGRYGKIWLLAYDTGRTSGNADGHVWYRHVLLGNQPLKDPTTGLTLVPDGGTGAPPGPRVEAERLHGSPAHNPRPRRRTRRGWPRWSCEAR